MEYNIGENMFDLFLINFGYVCGSFNNLEDAIKKAKDTGFQCAIYESFQFFSNEKLPNKLVWSNV